MEEEEDDDDDDGPPPLMDEEEDEDDEDDAYEAMQHGSPSKRPLEVSLPHISRQG